MVNDDDGEITLENLVLDEEEVTAGGQSASNTPSGIDILNNMADRDQANAIAAQVLEAMAAFEREHMEVMRWMIGDEDEQNGTDPPR